MSQLFTGQGDMYGRDLAQKRNNVDIRPSPFISPQLTDRIELVPEPAFFALFMSELEKKSPVSQIGIEAVAYSRLDLTEPGTVFALYGENDETKNSRIKFYFKVPSDEQMIQVSDRSTLSLRNEFGCLSSSEKSDNRLSLSSYLNTIFYPGIFKAPNGKYLLRTTQLYLVQGAEDKVLSLKRNSSEKRYRVRIAEIIMSEEQYKEISRKLIELIWGLEEDYI